MARTALASGRADFPSAAVAFRRINATRAASNLMAIALGVLLIPMALNAIAQQAILPLWWSALVWLGSLGGFVLCLLRRPIEAARLLFVVTAGAFLSLPLVTHPGMTFESSPWPLSLYITCAGTSCLIATRPRVWLPFVLALMVLRWWLGTTDVWSPPGRLLLADALFGVTMSAIGYACLQTARITERRIEEAQALAAQQFADSRALEATNRAAQYWDGYLHDQVLVALTAISRGAPDIRAIAAAAIPDPTQLDPTHLPIPKIMDGLVASVLTLCPMARTSFTVSADAVKLTHNVRLALLEASAEALRNVTTHAWPDGFQGVCDVTVRHDHRSVTITIEDDGVGFDPSRVSVIRLGILVSIQGRLDAVNGSAQVTSRRGQGTRIDLEWPTEGRRK